MNEYKAVFPSVIYFIPGKQKKKKQYSILAGSQFSNADTVNREHLVSVYFVKIPLYMISGIYKISTL